VRSPCYGLGMKTFILSTTLCSLLCLSAEATPTHYELQPVESSLTVRLYRASSIASALGHDHVVAATRWIGTVVWDEEDPTACAVSITIPVMSLRPDSDDLRAQFDLGESLDQDKRQDIFDNMISESLLFGSEHGLIEYRSTGCVVDGSVINVSGAVTIRGVERPLQVPLSISVTEGQFRATGSFNLNQTDFGFQPFSIMAGAIRLRDEMIFDLAVVGLPE
jgi:polyisoprenoid-binding protein YceI